MTERDENIIRLRESMRDVVPAEPAGAVRNIGVVVYGGETSFAEYQVFRNGDWHRCRAWINWDELAALTSQQTHLWDRFLTVCATRDMGVDRIYRCSIIEEVSRELEQRFALLNTEHNLWLLWRNTVIRGYRLKHSTVEQARWSFPTVGPNSLTISPKQLDQLLGV
jgi:hypothetical protein